MTHWKRTVAVLLLISILAVLLTGCWDNQEIDSLFIITGIALDVGSSPEQITIVVQIGNVKRENSGSQSVSSSEDSIILKTANETVLGGLTELDRNSNQTLIMHHNEILLLGEALAKKGIKSHLDLFMRDQQTRLDVPVVVVEDKAEKALMLKLPEKGISAIFIAEMFSELSKISMQYRVRLFDVATKLLDGTTSVVIPTIKIEESEGKEKIKLTGMAVFKGDKMIGTLNNEEVMGYLYSLGGVSQCNFEVTDGDNKVVFHIFNLDCKRSVTLNEDGRVRVDLSVSGVLDVEELSGFKKLTAETLIPHLTKIAQNEIAKKISNTFITAQKLDADIYGYGASIHQKYPKEWKDMEKQWDPLFHNIDFAVQVKVKVPSTGQIIQSLESETEKNEN